MPRYKKKTTAIETGLDDHLKSHAPDEQLTSEPVTSPKGSAPQQPKPPLQDNIREQLRVVRNSRAVVEGERTSLPNDDFKKTHREIWQRLGFYSNHANHNPTTINEDFIKSMMAKSRKLGKVVAKYRLFINKPTGKRAMLIQYPTRKRGQAYRAAYGNKPLELRIKPKSGIVEVDVPVGTRDNYDKEKGVVYGQAMRKGRLLQEGGSYSLGGGLGIGPKPASRGDHGASALEGPSLEKLLENFDDANNKGHVLNKSTLGGQIYPLKNGDPIYMVATFKEGEHI